MQILALFSASPCLKKIQRTSFFFGKNVKPCLTSRLPLASSCLRTMRQKLSATSRLPLGGRLLAKQGGEGRSLLRTPFIYTVFSIAKTSKIVCLVPRLPLGGRLRREAVVRGTRFFERLSFTLFFLSQKRQKLSALFQGFPLPEKNSANFIFFGKNVKPCLTSRLPHGGLFLPNCRLRQLRQPAVNFVD